MPLSVLVPGGEHTSLEAAGPPPPPVSGEVAAERGVLLSEWSTD